MKVFKDLEFIERSFMGGVQAIMEFDSGFKISVVGGAFAYSTPRLDFDHPDEFSSFEVAIFNQLGDFVTSDFIESPDGDVVGWLSREQITELMKQVQTINI
jgi:hypothetical protein